MRVLIIDPPHPYLKAQLQDMQLDFDEDFESPKEALMKKLDQYDGLVVRSRITLDKAFLEKGEKLKFIARYGVGLEHIDRVYAAEKGIEVYNSPEGSMDTVAEHAMGMLLMLMNKLGRADRQVRQNIWSREPNRGVEIKGKVVGILGYGNMGKSFAKRISGFEAAKVIAYDKYKTNYGDVYAQEVSLETLWTESDILSIHIYYEPDNHHLINKQFLQKFNKPIYLVNTARGLVLHTADLVEAIESGKILGAALDVIEYEEMSFVKLDLANLPAPFKYLQKSDQVVLAPHIAGWSHESKLGHAKVLAQKIKNFIERSR